ncbi:MAG: alcohol dehydrogenase [Gammaproteobacteria bacterium]|jgi:NADPH:quinone reductase-like Zn-dependent oxidoreductase|nr:alcohol dehydrogenase [Gammaproteobacteria bacterium]
MRAVRLRHPGGLDNLYLSSSEAAAPRADEITVRVHASSLNYHDYLVAIGKLPTPDGRIPMSDGAGEVIAVGAEVREFKVGDRVISTFFRNCPDGDPRSQHHKFSFGDGVDGFACEMVTLPVTAVTRAPQGYSDLEGATLTCAGLTAWRALVTNGHVRPGDTVLTQGSGGVSIFALQFAKAAGAVVIATSSSDEKLERLKKLGADLTINYRDMPEWGREARRLTDGRGVDHVIEIGGAGSFSQSITACCEGGHIAMIGVLAGYKAEISTVSIMARQLRVIGVAVGNRAQQIDMIRAIEVNRIRPVIDSHYRLENLAEAFRYQETGRHFGKICLSF